MIQGSKKINSESDYRATALDSSSSLKDFSLDRKLYFRRYIMSEVVEDKFNQAILMGQVVDCLLLESHLFDLKFYMSACAKAPTGNMLKFVESLYLHTKEATSNEGEITRSFEDISRDAYVDSEYKISYERVIGNFFGSDSEIYYNEIRQVRSNGLSVVTTQDVTNAERIVEELKTNFVTKDIINLVDSQRWEIKKQFQIEGYEIDNHLFKSMLDECVIDHQEKTIQIYDLKCTFSVDGFARDYFLYRRSYIQGYLYFKAVQSLTQKIDSNWYGYKVLNPKFIVVDSISYMNPLIYYMTTKDLENAYEGFNYNNKYYPGVKEIILDLKFAQEYNIWNISRENYQNNGVVSLNIS